MQVQWKKTIPTQTPIGTLTLYDGGSYKLFLSDTFSYCYKVKKTESIDESTILESISVMP